MYNICSAHGHRQAYICWRICDYNHINWSISLWKHHIHIKACGSFQPYAAYIKQKPGNRRRVGRVTACSLASASLYGLHEQKIITALSALFCLTRRNFTVFLLRIPTSLSATFFCLCLTLGKLLSKNKQET